MTRSQSASYSVHQRPISLLIRVYPRPSATHSLHPRALTLASRPSPWDFFVFRPFSWDSWDNRGRVVGVVLETRHSELSLGFLVFPAILVGLVGKPGGRGSGRLATRNSALGTRNWFTNLQTITSNLQPFFPKLLGLSMLIPLGRQKNWMLITVRSRSHIVNGAELGGAELETRNSELGTRNWFTNLQLTTFNLQPISVRAYAGAVRWESRSRAPLRSRHVRTGWWCGRCGTAPAAAPARYAESLRSPRAECRRC